MGYNLRNQEGETYPHGRDTWPALLMLARRHGWQPTGTALYNWREDSGNLLDRSWSGEYCSQDGQRVSAEDAARLASAIEQALDGDLHGRFSDEEKNALRGFIRFCRAGSFIIL